MSYIEFVNSIYAYMIGFFPNSLLLAYTILKMIQLSSESSLASKDQIYGVYRRIVIPLIFLASLSRCFLQVDKILLKYGFIKQSDIWYLVLDIVDFLPTISFITLASFFSNSWHRHYKTFENRESAIKRHRQYFYFLVIFNVSLYVASLSLVLKIWQYPTADYWQGVYGILTLALIIITVLIVSTGRKLYNRALNFVNYAGRSIQSGDRFKKIWVLLITCSVLSCINSGMNLTLAIYARDGRFSGRVFEYLSIFFLIAFDAFAGPGLFFSLIGILNMSYEKCESLLSSEEKCFNKHDYTEESNEFSVSTY